MDKKEYPNNLEGVKEAGKDIAEVPVEAVKTTVEVEKKGIKVIEKTLMLPIKKRRSILHFFWRSKGGVIAGCADNDPSGIVTYTQTGAIAGFHLLWLTLIAWPMLTVVEEMSARIGVVTRKGVNEVIIENYGRLWAYIAALIVLVCNIFTIGADIAAMGDVAHILTKIPAVVFVILFGSLFYYLLWKKGYKTISTFLFILTPFFLLYVASAFLLPVPWGEALRSAVIPNLSSFNLNLAFIAVAFLGTTVNPFLIFWETTQEIEENKGVRELKQEGWATAAGMFFSQFITFFIVVAAAAAFAGHNMEITTAKEAALALKPLGNASFLLFSFGILAAGLLGIPVLAASTGYTISETFGWRRGLDEKVSHARGFYVVMIASLLIGMIIALSGINAILMLLYSQVLAGLLMPILLTLLLLITNNKKILGIHTNKFISNFFGVLAIAAIIFFDILMVWNWIK